MNKLEKKALRILQDEIDKAASKIEDARWSLATVEKNKKADPKAALKQLDDAYKSLFQAHEWINAFKDN